jgi:hypothetical protein
MIGGPIAMYFLTVNTIFKGQLSPPKIDYMERLSNFHTGNSTFAGAGAAVTANIVLFAYIFVAWQEDQEEQQMRKEKKAQ